MVFSLCISQHRTISEAKVGGIKLLLMEYKETVAVKMKENSSALVKSV